jgi:hypothetical protein
VVLCRSELNGEVSGGSLAKCPIQGRVPRRDFREGISEKGLKFFSPEAKDRQDEEDSNQSQG